MTKREFCLKALREYIQDPSKCGYEDGSCKYLTSDGRKCVAGKYFLPTFTISNDIVVSSILQSYSQEEVFIPEVVGILTANEWEGLQAIHDSIANCPSPYIIYWVKSLGLFTFEELIALKN